MNKKQKLELTWIGKDEQPVLEPRILIEDPTKSYGDPHSENMLIHGDNLLALKALEQKFAGKIKCIYIDPPYNTGSAFEHYDDGVEHSLWLSMMRGRLELLGRLLAPEGVLFVQIDDNEGQYLRVLMDEVFGRRNFVTTFIWRKVDSPNDNKVFITPDHEYILCFARDIDRVQLSRKVDPSLLDAYSQRDEKGRLYRDRLLKKNGKNSMRADRPSMFFSLRAPDGCEVYPIHDDGKEARWAMGNASIDELKARGDLIWKNRGTDDAPRWIPYSREYAPGSPQRPYPTIWSDIHTTRQAKAHQKEVLPDVPLFDTPKPEPLIQRILEMTTKPGDWVLDSFLGSGTTAAVAHKMGRKWIGVELGDHCDTHCLPRLQKVCDGTDQGGISTAVEWKGGGGFKYYDLAPSLLKQDTHGNYVISEEYNADMLAAAMTKQEGFIYAPSQECYWKQGFSTEQDFMFTTTNHVTQAMIDQISEEMAEGEHLLICCKKFSAGCETRHPNIQIKKIPSMLMGRCEFDKEDYSLNIVNLTDEATAPAFVPQGPKTEARTHGNKNPNQLELF